MFFCKFQEEDDLSFLYPSLHVQVHPCYSFSQDSILTFDQSSHFKMLKLLNMISSFWSLSNYLESSLRALRNTSTVPLVACRHSAVQDINLHQGQLHYIITVFFQYCFCQVRSNIGKCTPSSFVFPHCSLLTESVKKEF